MKKDNSKKLDKGITLIALIITIIVLIILAAVTIITFRDSKLIETAINGTVDYANAQTEEEYIVGEIVKQLDEAIPKIEQNGGAAGEGTGGNEGKLEQIKKAVSITAVKMNINIKIGEMANTEGIKEFKYKVSSAEGVTGGEGIINLGESAEITTTVAGSYTVTITVVDNEGNETEIKRKTVTTSNKLTLASAKDIINEENLKEYLGEEVEYNPEGGGTWRVFYYDGEEGYFGTPNTLYLKRDYDESITDPGNQPNYEPTEETLEIMKKMNPKWAKSSNSTDGLQSNERTSVYFYEQEKWSKYKAEGASLVMASPGVEMYMKSYNISKGSDNALICEIGNTNGYKVGANGVYENSGYNTYSGTVDKALANGMYSHNNYWWLVSSACSFYDTVLCVSGEHVTWSYYKSIGVCPVVSFG